MQNVEFVYILGQVLAKSCAKFENFLKNCQIFIFIIIQKNSKISAKNCSLLLIFGRLFETLSSVRGHSLLSPYAGSPHYKRIPGGPKNSYCRYFHLQISNFISGINFMFSLPFSSFIYKTKAKMGQIILVPFYWNSSRSCYVGYVYITFQNHYFLEFTASQISFWCA